MRFKKKFKLFLILPICLIGLISVARFCHHQTQGFRISKIQHNLLERSLLSLPAEADQLFLATLFQKKFKFLGRGLQSFVFASEDGQYVLKVFNNRYQRKIALFSLLSSFPMIGPWANQRKTYYQEKLNKTFDSYRIAFNEMKDLTGLIYVHLYETSDLPGRICLVDKLNIVHLLDPNHIGFLIQKKATLVYPTLKEYITHSDFRGAEQAISSLIHLFFWKWHHQILDNDPLIRTNYGFINGKAMQIDVGPLSKAAFPQKSKEIYRDEISHITTSLKFWLTENCPRLVPFLDQELERQLSLDNDDFKTND